MEKFPTGEPTPEQKAKLQTSRTLSDAALINHGAKFAPDSTGEPVLEVTENQINEAKIVMMRETPESQQLIKLFNMFGRNNEMHSDVRGPEISRDYNGDYNNPRHYRTNVYFEKNETDPSINMRGGRPYIAIKRTVSGKNSWDETNNVQPCYSLEEYYKNLRDSEKEKGEALGKNWERLLSKE